MPRRPLRSKILTRQFPLLSGLHRVIDGSIVGLMVAVVMMSAISLHWRHLWIVAYKQLDITRDLSQRLNEATSLIEQHILMSKRLPSSMVPTKSADLIYLDKPTFYNSKYQNDLKISSFFKRVFREPIRQGY